MINIIKVPNSVHQLMQECLITKLFFFLTILFMFGYLIEIDPVFGIDFALLKVHLIGTFALEDMLINDILVYEMVFIKWTNYLLGFLLLLLLLAHKPLNIIGVM